MYCSENTPYLRSDQTGTPKLFKIITQSIYDSLMKLNMSLKLSLCAKFTREKMSFTERKSLAIFQLCETPGFLNKNSK
jgi:hypothetical protein